MGLTSAVPGLPALLVVSDRRQTGRLGLVATVAAAVTGGARAVVLREKDLERSERTELGCALVELLAAVGGTVSVAGADVELARNIGAHGLHLAWADPFPEDRNGLVVGRSCHDARELGDAGTEEVDYATVSPVFPSSSKPGYGPAITTAGLTRLVGGTAVPLVALGGVTPANARSCLDAGAAAVAVMGAVMSADDPAAATAELLTALSCPSHQNLSGSRR